MNLISKTTSVILHPVRTAGSVAGQTVGVAAAGARTTMRLIDRAAGRVRGNDSSDAWSVADTATSSGAPETGTPEATLVEPVAQKAPAQKKAAQKKAAPRKAPSARAATVAPALSEPEAVIEEEVVRTPSGISAADEGHNPDTAETDLHQPGTEPLMDPATVKAVKSEADVMQKAADPDKG